MRTWILAVIAALGVTIGGFNVGRAADANCPTCTQEAQAGDALSIFLAMMQSAPPGAFKYQDAKSLGPNAFELTGVVFMSRTRQRTADPALPGREHRPRHPDAGRHAERHQDQA